MADRPVAIFRVMLPDGSTRLARGPVDGNPEDVMPRGMTLDSLLADGGPEIRDLMREPSVGDVPDGAQVLAPIEGQEVWGAGVTYQRSREGRVEESTSAADIYDLVYDAARPELFHKAAGWRVLGHGQCLGVRADSSSSVPEPELALVIDAQGTIVGATIGNDMTARSIEAENPLYLPQAKTFDGACALGPGIVPIDDLQWPLVISMQIERGGRAIFRASTDTGRARRSIAELTSWLFRALAFPTGVVLLTGTGIVPPSDISLLPDDSVRIEIGGLGCLENGVQEVGRASS